MEDPILDYQRPEPSPTFRWRNIPKLMLITVVIMTFFVGGLLILDHFTGWVTLLDH
jgi:hypothetical protein